jgi:hypothetical protein
MLRKPAFAVITSTAVLLVYCWLIAIDSTAAFLIFAISPFLVLWTAYTIIRYGVYDGRELDKDEWGYEDKNNDDLGVF